MAHSLPHNLKNLCHSQSSQSPRHTDKPVQICGHCFHVLFFICLKPVRFLSSRRVYRFIPVSGLMTIPQHGHLPSGYVKIASENGPFIDDLSIDSMVIFNSYVSLPEGNGGFEDGTYPCTVPSAFQPSFHSLRPCSKRMGLELVEFPAHLRKRATPTEMGF